MTFEGWVPVAVREAEVEWRHLPGVRFAEPFFEDTLRRQRAESRRTTLQELAAWVAAHPGLPPAGFIFHMSRCGSTLVSQMLAAVAENRVMSEPVPVDDVLKLGDPAALRAIAGALAQPVAGEMRFFLKFDCWHIHQYELIRRAFPETPAVFLYRHPLEVLVSQLRNPGMWTVSGASVPREQHVAGLLAAILESALRHVTTAGAMRPVNYTELPQAVYEMFGIRWSAEQSASMARAAGLDAKSPHFEFAPDSEAKRTGATDRAREAAAPLMALYQRLQASREKRA
jgi:hypothetical protein